MCVCDILEKNKYKDFLNTHIDHIVEGLSSRDMDICMVMCPTSLQL